MRDQCPGHTSPIRGREGSTQMRERYGLGSACQLSRGLLRLFQRNRRSSHRAHLRNFGEFVRVTTPAPRVLTTMSCIVSPIDALRGNGLLGAASG